MNAKTILSAVSSRRLASLIRETKRRVIFAAPGIQTETAAALAKLQDVPSGPSITVSLDFDERTLRLGYGSLEGVEMLRESGIELTHSPGLRSAILIVDDRGWVFTPTALYLEPEPQSDETPNAVELSSDQVGTLAIRLSREAQQEAADQAGTPAEANEIVGVRQELGIVPITANQFGKVRSAIEIAPPVEFDVVRQVRVFEPYLQYVELKLSGTAVERRRVNIPKVLQCLGASKDLGGKLKTTFDLIGKSSSLSSAELEADLNGLRKNFSPSLGKGHGRVVLMAAKPHLEERIVEFTAKLEAHQKKLELELQSMLDESKTELVEHYLPLALNNPPDALLGSLFNPGNNEGATRQWIDDELAKVFPAAPELISKMALEVRYKDVTFETLNEPDFLDSVKSAFPRIDWEKAFDEFLAAGERLAR